MASTSSSSSITASKKRQNERRRYDVFLSFRGEDTRNAFTGHLHDKLFKNGLYPFRDNDEIGRGEELKPEIEIAIKASKASIVVLSENYATSTWCLEELCCILQQRSDHNHFVLPVFYHVDPSDVRNQTKSYAIEAKASSRRTDENVSRWKAALSMIADLTGVTVSGNRPETEVLKAIVDILYDKLDRKEVDTRYKEIESWSDDPNLPFLMKCGMGGSGKTTLAKYIYNSNWKKFETRSFVEDIDLQKQLLKDILGGKKKNIHGVQAKFKTS